MDFPPSRYDGVPDGLLDLARSRILRGLPLYGVTGNGLYVLRAREVLRRWLISRVPFPVENWKGWLFRDDVPLAAVTVANDSVENLVCPCCYNPI